MEKGSDEGVMKKLSESVTIICFNGITYQMNELKIGRMQKFSLLLVKELETVANLLKSGGIEELDLKTLITNYSEETFAVVARIFNFIFEYKNDDYKKVSKKWIEDNLSVRNMVEIISELARQNKIDWLLPFFKSRLKPLLQNIPDEMIATMTTPELN